MSSAGERQREVLRLRVEDELGADVELAGADPGIAQAQREALEDARRLERERLRRRLALRALDVEGEAVDADRQDRARREGAHPRPVGEKAAEAAEIVAAGMAVGAQVDALAEAGDAVEVDAGVEDRAAERARQRVVGAEEAAGRALAGLEDEDRGARRLPCLEGRFQGGAGGVAGEEQAPLDLAEGEAALADEGRDHGDDPGPDQIGHARRVDALDIAVHDGQAEFAAVLQGLRGQDDAHEHVAGAGIGRLELAHGLEELARLDRPPDQALLKGAVLGGQGGKRSLDGDALDAHREAVRPRRGIEPRSAREDDGSARRRPARPEARRGDLAGALREGGGGEGGEAKGRRHREDGRRRLNLVRYGIMWRWSIGGEPRVS